MKCLQLEWVTEGLDIANVRLVADGDPDINYFCESQSNYYTIDHFNPLLNVVGYLLLNIYIRNVGPNCALLESFWDALGKDPDIIVLTETWLFEGSKKLLNIKK